MIRSSMMMQKLNLNLSKRRPVVKLKKSCETCYQAKIKCSGERPNCARCRDRRVVCKYLPRRDNHNPVSVLSSYNGDNSTDKCPNELCFYAHEGCQGRCVSVASESIKHMLLPPLNIHDELKSLNGGTRCSFSWAVFYSLHLCYARHEATTTTCFDLRRQLMFFKQYLLHCNDKQSRLLVSRINTMIEATGIDLDYFFAKVGLKMRKGYPNRQSLTTEMLEHFSSFKETRYSGGVIKSGKIILDQMLATLRSDAGKRTAVIRARADFAQIDRPCSRFLEINTNEAAEIMFNKTGEEMKEFLLTNIEGCFPYGAGVMSLLAANEDEFIGFLQTQCVKFATWGFPRHIPYYMELPDVSLMSLSIRKSINDTVMEPMKFIVTTLLRRVMDEYSTFEEAYYMFQPLEPLDHLFEQDAETAFVDASLPDYETELKYQIQSHQDLEQKSSSFKNLMACPLSPEEFLSRRAELDEILNEFKASWDEDQRRKSLVGKVFPFPYPPRRDSFTSESS